MVGGNTVQLTHRVKSQTGSHLMSIESSAANSKTGNMWKEGWVNLSGGWWGGRQGADYSFV